jgi:LuxR family maltose regulon positive regulatory protein
MLNEKTWYSKQKLRKPQIGKTLARSRLSDLLDAGGKKKLVLVCAPSGYGKTTLVSSYVERGGRKTFWYRLDKTDTDPIVFINYLVEAIRKEFRNFGAQVRTRLKEVENVEQELEQVLIVLVNELVSKVDEEITIVLDDFDEVAESQAIRTVMNYILGELPSNIHLIIVSRALPDLSLARLRVGREVTIIDTEDLKFKKEEIKHLFASLYPLPLDNDELENLTGKTEGWIASLLLFYDSLKDVEKDKRREFILSFMGTKDIYEYLAEEVFEKEDEKVKTFLRKTSILAYINEKLGILLTGMKDSKQILEHLEKKHVFTARINNSYKYHPLFKQFLSSKVSEEGKDYLQQLNKKAAIYFKENSDTNQAICHFFEAHMYEDAKELIIEISDEMINTSRLSTLANFINRLPASFQANPHILLSKSKILEIQGRVDESLCLLREAFDAFRDQENKQGMGISLAKQGELYRLECEYDRAITLLEESLFYLPEERHAFILYNLASCYLRIDLQESMNLLKQALALSQKVKDKATEATILHNLSLPHLIRGEFQEALALMQKSLAIREKSGNRHEMAHTLSFMSMIYRMQGDYEKSLKISEEALEIVEEYDYRRVKGWVLWTQAETYLEIREIEKALSLVRESIVIFDDLHDRWGLSFALRVLARVYEFEEQYNKAVDFLRQALKVAETSGGEWETALSFSDLGRLYIKSDNPKQAESFLLEAKHKDKNFDSKYTLVSVYIRLAYLYFKTKEYEKAEDNLTKAINISKENEFHHLLSQEARETLPLLTWAFAKGISMDYLGRILFRMASEKLYRQDEVTIIFADIRKFTNMSEDLAPEEIRQVLNTYLAFLTEIIFQHKGTLDKYIGDAIMAFFSEQEGEQHHAVRAVEAAFEMQEEIRLFQMKAQHLPKISYGIGLNTGKVVLGHIGSGRRLDFTILGDPVNIASRLCSKAKPNQILIGANTYDYIKDVFQARKIGPIKLKGKSKLVCVYEVQTRKTSPKELSLKTSQK